MVSIVNAKSLLLPSPYGNIFRCDALMALSELMGREEIR